MLVEIGPEEITSRWVYDGAPPADEQIEAHLQDANEDLAILMPDLAGRLEADPTSPVDLEARVKRVIRRAVLRFLSNPDQRTQQAIGDRSFAQRADGRSELWFTSAELESLAVPESSGTGRAYTASTIPVPSTLDPLECVVVNGPSSPEPMG